MAKTPKKTTTKRKTVARKPKTVTPLAAYNTIKSAYASTKEAHLTKPQILSELTRSTHSDLQAYVPVGLAAAKEDPNFFGHLIAWNAIKGQIRDSQIALPVIGFASRPDDAELMENALAHLAALTPRNFLKALDFCRSLKVPSRMTRRLIKRYIKDLEADKYRLGFAMLQHRDVLKELYTRFGLKGDDRAEIQEGVIRGHATEGALAAIKQLKNMTPDEAAATIVQYKIPFIVASGALGQKSKDPSVLMALINAMTPTELVTNTKALEKLGFKNDAACRSAFEEKLKKVATSGKAPTLKTTKAAEAVSDEKLKAKLEAAQENQLKNAKGIDGNWLVLADKSGSMSSAIKASQEIAALLTAQVRGKVHLVFFDNDPYYYDVTGKSFKEITDLTKRMSAGGGTRIGCGLRKMMDDNLVVDGIAVVSDGADHGYPTFGEVYQKYSAKFGTEPTVYLYNLPGETNTMTRDCQTRSIDVQEFPLRDKQMDYYSLPNLVQTMRVGRYSLLDEVLDTELKTLDGVLKKTVGLGVITNGSRTTVAETV